MDIFSIYSGASRVKFSVVFEENKYRAKVNEIIIAEGTDYEAVREHLLVDMKPQVDLSKLH